MSSTPFGEHLRREREMRGVSLAEIAAATRISTRFLEALEKEQWDQLPGGAFNRGFIRSIARFLGIDEDGLVAEYAWERESAAGRRAAAHTQRIPRDYRPAVTAVALALLLIAGGFWGLEHHGEQIKTGIHNRFTAGAAAAVANAPSAARNPPARTEPRIAIDPPLPPVTSPAALGLTLTITASKRSDVSVLADGKPVFAGRIRRNEAKQFEARDTIEIDSSEVKSLALTLNGRPVTWAGASSNPRKMTLTRKALSTPAEPSH
jgi:cytoskeleton protein RodZ